MTFEPIFIIRVRTVWSAAGRREHPTETFTACHLAIACIDGQSRCRRRNGAVFDPRGRGVRWRYNTSTMYIQRSHRFTYRLAFKAADGATTTTTAPLTLVVSGIKNLKLKSHP